MIVLRSAIKRCVVSVRKRTVVAIFFVTLSVSNVAGRDGQDWLSETVARSGGRVFLEQAQTYYAKGETCTPQVNKTFHCSEFREWMTPKQWRYESPYSMATAVTVYGKSGGTEFLDGTWMGRVFSRLAGVTEGPVDPGEVEAFWEARSRSPFRFLLEGPADAIEFEGQEYTLEGSRAQVFSIQNQATVRYFFDPASRMCLQQTIIRPGGTPNHVLFGDYRAVSGGRIPFRTRFFHGNRLLSEERIHTFRIDSDIDASLFVGPRIKPLWLEPVAILALLAISALIWFVVRRTRKSRPHGIKAATLL